MKKFVTLVMVAAATSFAMTSCGGEETPEEPETLESALQDLGSQLDEAMDEVGAELEAAMEEVGDVVEDITTEVEEVMEDVTTEEVEEITE